MWPSHSNIPHSVASAKCGLKSTNKPKSSRKETHMHHRPTLNYEQLHNSKSHQQRCYQRRSIEGGVYFNKCDQNFKSVELEV